MSLLPNKTSVKIARLLATWFGVGLTPAAPGTAGALAALPLHWLFVWAGAPAVESIFVVAICALGVWAAEVTQQDMAVDDPQVVVIDEVAGTLIALTVAGGDLIAQLIAFGAFRALDILKPCPISRLERLPHGGAGIMADDIMAGIISALLVVAWRHPI